MGPEMDTRLPDGKALKVRKPISAVLWNMGTGQVTEKPARGRNPEARNVVRRGKPDLFIVTEPVGCVLKGKETAQEGQTVCSMDLS